MRFLVTGILLFTIILGCQKSSSNGQVLTTNNPSLKLLSEFKTQVPEPSGLAYNKKRNTLFTVSDGNSTVYEIGFTGEILNSFKIDNVDLEGVAFSANCDTMYVVDEAFQLVAKYLMNGRKLSSFPVHVATKKDHSIEGITIDDQNHIVVVNEKAPCLLIRFNGEIELSRIEINSVKDCADITYDKTLGCYWLLSDESKKVVKLSKSGLPLYQYLIPFKKGEGIAVVGDKIYIVNDDSGKLFVFEKP